MRPVSTAVLMCQNNAEYITRWRGSILTPEATGFCHRVSIRVALHRRPTGRSKQNNNKKMYHFCWPFRLPWWCAGTTPQALPNGGGPGLRRKPLVDATGQALRSKIAQLVIDMPVFLEFFHRHHAQKGTRVTSRPPIAKGV